MKKNKLRLDKMFEEIGPLFLYKEANGNEYFCNSNKIKEMVKISQKIFDKKVKELEFKEEIKIITGLKEFNFRMPDFSTKQNINCVGEGCKDCDKIFFCERIVSKGETSPRGLELVFINNFCLIKVSENHDKQITLDLRNNKAKIFISGLIGYITKYYLS